MAAALLRWRVCVCVYSGNSYTLKCRQEMAGMRQVWRETYAFWLGCEAMLCYAMTWHGMACYVMSWYAMWQVARVIYTGSIGPPPASGMRTMRLVLCFKMKEPSSSA